MSGRSRFAGVPRGVHGRHHAQGGRGTCALSGDGRRRSGLSVRMIQRIHRVGYRRCARTRLRGRCRGSPRTVCGPCLRSVLAGRRGRGRHGSAHSVGVDSVRWRTTFARQRALRLAATVCAGAVRRGRALDPADRRRRPSRGRIQIRRRSRARRRRDRGPTPTTIVTSQPSDS